MLLIDSDAGFRQMLRLALGKSGAEIIEASNEADAVLLLRQHQPHIVLAEIPLPESGGWAMVTGLRQQLAQARIIAMSAGGRASAESFLSTARAAGADAVLAKPFSLEELGAALMQPARG